MFVCLLICLFFYFNNLGTPTGSYLKKFVKIWLDLAGIFRIKKGLFVCLFVCYFIGWFVFILIILEHPQEVTLEILWRSDLIWLGYLGSKNVYLFVCLFVCLYICLFFCFNPCGPPTESSHENFMKIWLDLAGIFRI